MNILILFIFLLIEFILFFCIAKKRLTSISLWASGTFLLSVISYIAWIGYFGKDISFDTVIVIEGSILCYFIGELLGTKKRIRIPRFTLGNYRFGLSDYSKVMIPKRGFIWAISFFILMIAAIRYYDMFLFVRRIGKNNIFMVIYHIRAYATAGEYSVGTLINLLSSVGEACAYVFTFYFMYNLIHLHKRYNILLMPIITYMLYLLTTTGRTGYLRFFLIVIGILYVLLKHSEHHFNIELKFIKYVIILLAAAIAIFFLYGLLARKSERSFFKYFADYFAAAIYGLDGYLESPWPSNDHFGQYTLSNYYYWRNRIFSTDFEIPKHHLPFFYWSSGKSNIYTGFILALQDFGILGLFITRILLGALYSMIESYLLRETDTVRHILLLIFFGYFLYVNFSLSVADRFIEFLTVITFPLFVISICLVNRLYIKSCRNIHKYWRSGS